MIEVEIFFFSLALGLFKTKTERLEKKGNNNRAAALDLNARHFAREDRASRRRHPKGEVATTEERERWGDSPFLWWRKKELGR